ncbi:MAG: hydroxymethylglutaryl-CoA lyase [Rhodocyclaceae bacterium]|nr:hydroxymethylglutaryl-CoA lyase [Rhodocyclaceae bacterium]
MTQIQLTEVVMRDGLQIEPSNVPTETKLVLIDRLAALGVPRLEVSSFVSPKAVPTLADADEVFARIKRKAGTVYAALVMNPRGAERAIAARADEVVLVVSASEAHNLANVGRDIAESFKGFATITAMLKGTATNACGAIAMSFGCPLEGDVPESRVFSIIENYLALGIRQISLADTTGMAYPTQVGSLCERAQQLYPEAVFGLHLHDTRGLGLANAYAALNVGMRRFDACLGGLGGCPFAPGASGNICTEDFVHMLHLMGFETGIDLEGLLDLRTAMEAAVGHPLLGQVGKAGTRAQFTRCATKV